LLRAPSPEHKTHAQDRVRCRCPCLPSRSRFGKDGETHARRDGRVSRFPNSWKISNVKRGFQAKSRDEEVYVWAELAPAQEIDAVQKEHEGYFEKQKVTMSKADPVGKEIDGPKCAFVDPDATYKGKRQ
jgi:hypothetical protein